MTGRWFRLYEDAVIDPKVQSLPLPLFKLWINLLCMASKNGGAIPPEDQLKTVLSLRYDHLKRGLKSLIDQGLIDQVEGRLEPHNWRKRQYKYETSAERTKRWRARKSDVTVTPPDTDTDTERVKKLNNNIIKTSNSCTPSLFSIKPGMPEWDAWQRYYQDHKKPPRAVQLAMQRVQNGQQKTMTVPAELPQQFDTSYAAALELKQKLNQNAS